MSTVRRRIEIKKSSIVPDLNLIEFNKNVQENLLKCQYEINYQIIDGVTYKKKIQKIFLDENVELIGFERFFMEQNVNSVKDSVMNGVLPFVFSHRIYDRLMGIKEYEPINRDLSMIFGQLKSLNFQLTLSFVKLLFDEVLKSGRNRSKFQNKLVKFFENNLHEFNNWAEIESEYGNALVFYLLGLLVRLSSNFTIYLSEQDISSSINSLKNIYMVHSRECHYSGDGILNLYQQLKNTNREVQMEEVPFISSREVPESSYVLYVYLVCDMRVKKVVQDGFYELGGDIWRNYPLFFHQATINFLNERRHNYIYNHLYTYLSTFNIFLNMKIKPCDRERYLLAGSVIKSMYNVRDCADVDFFVLDHESHIERYGRYAPNVGMPGIFDDFGKTYYGNEDFYYDMNSGLYDKQKEEKEKQREVFTVAQEPMMILNNYPKFSVSGLKAGRYIDIYSAECRGMGYDIDCLDDLVSDPDLRIYFLGCPVIQLKLEMIRDIIKNIDLKRVSLKQMHDLHYLRHNCEYLFSMSDLTDLGFSRLETKSQSMIRKPKIDLVLNCYHRPARTIEKVGLDLVIRRMPLYLEDLMRTMVLEGPLLVSQNNEESEVDGRRVYQRPLLSSLPHNMENGDSVVNVLYYYELSSNGELKILINPVDETGMDVSFFRDICIVGSIRVDQIENVRKVMSSETKKEEESVEIVKKIYVSVDTGGKMKRIFSQIPLVERKKEYRMMLFNFMKSVITLHKLVDVHTKEKVVIERLSN